MLTLRGVSVGKWRDEEKSPAEQNFSTNGLRVVEIVVQFVDIQWTILSEGELLLTGKNEGFLNRRDSALGICVFIRAIKKSCRSTWWE